MKNPEDRFNEAGKAFERLCRVMAQLRAPNGCAWDREQTLESLKPYLIEEAYEVLHAIEQKDTGEHCKELGDLLLQVVFQSEITCQEGSFSIADVADAITEKLIRRHPHVFGDEKANDSSAALSRWEAEKAKERPKESSVLDGVPRALPGLLRAMRASQKAAAVGFDWPSIDGSREKVEEEWKELTSAIDQHHGDVEKEHELGDLLFAVVNLSRHLKIDPEEALRLTIDRFQRRFKFVEHSLAEKNRTPKEASLEEMDALWEQAKAAERQAKKEQK